MFKLSNVGLSGFEVEKKRGGKNPPRCWPAKFFCGEWIGYRGEGCFEKLFVLLITTFTTIERRK